MGLKSILVTGAGQGIGRACALRFARAGYGVFILDIDAGNANRVKKEIESANGTADVIIGDVRDYHTVEKACGEIAARFGHIDVLINNAGIAIPGSLKFYEPDEWERIKAVNIFGVFNCSKAALKHMIGQKSGLIINLSSCITVNGSSHEIGYAVSKGVIDVFTRSLAREVGKYNIRVNAVLPLILETELSQGFGERFLGSLAFMKQAASLKDYISVEDVANAAFLIAADEARFMTGNLVKVDAGVF
jgi:3-oxoacyl-[acyl-carrier protein] reductase